MQPVLIDEYNYPLPEQRIAKYPLQQRDHSKLLVYRKGEITEDLFFHIGNHIPPDSLLVYNNTRVIQARLVFHKTSGARIEVLCLEPSDPHDYQLSLGSTTGCTWKCMIGNAKKFRDTYIEMPVNLPKTNEQLTLRATKGEQTGNTFSVHFSWSDTRDPVSFAGILDAVGELPIPPYLNRPTEESDKTTYQTVYSRIKGSVAAPTAGLHFTDQVLQQLRDKGIHTTELTLHVGAGTFQPVKTEDANLHTMHSEIIAVPRQAITDILNNLQHIVAVGTTSMRTLESLYFIGEMLQHNNNPTNIHVPQFMPYNTPHTITTQQALQNIIGYLDHTNQQTLHAATQIMIEPGYTFHLVNQLITNFHQPKSTLLLLVSAFVGEDWHAIYNYALSHDFRFLSYGDSSILSRKQPDD